MSRVPPGQIEFWFDFASTYAYLSAMRIAELAFEREVTVLWRPFLLGPVFQAQGWDTSPFNIYPAKGAYMWRDMERLARLRGLPFMHPDPFPQHSLLAARVALATRDVPKIPAFVRSVFSAQFGDGRDISNPETLRICLERAGLPLDLIEMAKSADTKQRLRDQTDAAVGFGIFGAPSFRAGSELFWGDDRLEMALDEAGKRPGP